MVPHRRQMFRLQTVVFNSVCLLYCFNACRSSRSCSRSFGHSWSLKGCFHHGHSGWLNIGFFPWLSSLWTQVRMPLRTAALTLEFGLIQFICVYFSHFLFPSTSKTFPSSSSHHMLFIPSGLRVTVQGTFVSSMLIQMSTGCVLQDTKYIFERTFW